MGQISDDHFAEFKRISAKEGITYETELEARESASRLVDFVSLLYDMSKEEWRREERLKNEPKGFGIIGAGQNCPLCMRIIDGDNLWYDKWGMKCMDCQKALNKHIIPGYVFKDRKDEMHITASTLSWKLGIHSATIRKLVRQGKLRARVIPNSDVLVFLKKENPDLAMIIEREKSSKS